MNLRDLPQTIEPEDLSKKTRRRSRQWGHIWFGALCIAGILLLTSSLIIVSHHFDTRETLNALVNQKKALILEHWSLEAHRCSSPKIDIKSCQTTKIDLNQNGKWERHPLSLPFSTNITEQLRRLPQQPNRLTFSYKLNENERNWLASRKAGTQLDWETQTQLIAISSIGCKYPGTLYLKNDERNSKGQHPFCSDTTQFFPIHQVLSNDTIRYTTQLSPNTLNAGFKTWTMIVSENQHVRDIISLAILRQSAWIVWGLISILIPAFLMALRLIFKNEVILQALADLSCAHLIYFICILALSESIVVNPSSISTLSAICVALDGIILALFIRYAFCVSSGKLWSSYATALISAMTAIISLSLLAVSKSTPTLFLTTSESLRNVASFGLGISAIFIGVHKRMSSSSQSNKAKVFHLAGLDDNFGGLIYVVCLTCVTIPLIVFGLSNLKELSSEQVNILNWEELQFIPNQTIFVTLYLGFKNTSAITYGRNIKERLEALFSSVLEIQKSLTPTEAIESAVRGIRETIPTTIEAEVEFIVPKTDSKEHVEKHISLTERTLSLALFGRNSLQGELRFIGANQVLLSDEDEDILTTLASALAITLENHESSSNLEKNHQAALRFVPYDFLKLLRPESFTDFNLGDHVEVRMTSLSADVRNLNQISEGMSSAQKLEFMNGLLSHLAPVITHHKGFIEKQMSDSLMTLFPVAPVHAMRCAVDLQIALRSFNDRWLGLINEEVRLGIGIHYGPMTLGIVGYADRLSSTIISNSLNRASYLNELANRYSADIIVSQEVLEHMSSLERNEFRVCRLDSSSVNDHRKMLTLFRVLIQDAQDLAEAS